MPTVASSLRSTGRPLFFFSRRAVGLKRKREKKPLLPGSSSPSDDHSYVQLTLGGGVRGSPLRAAAAFARLRSQIAVSGFMESNEFSGLKTDVSPSRSATSKHQPLLHRISVRLHGVR